MFDDMFLVKIANKYLLKLKFSARDNFGLLSSKMQYKHKILREMPLVYFSAPLPTKIRIDKGLIIIRA